MSEHPATPAQGAPARHPLTVAPGRRHLVDQDGRPFLLVGDAGWSILVGLTREEAVRYLDDRAARGFNAILVNLLEYYFAPDPPRNRYGEPPFLTPGDFSTPNPAYFDHARWVLERAAERNILVLLCTCYLGYRDAGWPGPKAWNEGWFGEVLKNGFDGCRAYGRFVGQRFGDLDDLVWVIGGDANPGTALVPICQMAEGIKEADPRHLMTAHCAPEAVPVEQYRGQPWLDFNNTYTYEIVHAHLYEDYARVPTMPTLLMEFGLRERAHRQRCPAPPAGVLVDPPRRVRPCLRGDAYLVLRPGLGGDPRWPGVARHDPLRGGVQGRALVDAAARGGTGSELGSTFAGAAAPPVGAWGSAWSGLLLRGASGGWHAGHGLHADRPETSARRLAPARPHAPSPLVRPDRGRLARRR